ncbi:hypothetical protein KEJ47_02835 [Candidatus Bathyarchaeota archaeon]|nr:hypothetical protein [Candidatus Bathyarchaeota archaeon]
MESPTKKSMNRFSAFAVILIVAIPLAYMAITYPRIVSTYSVSFTLGINSKRIEFEVPFLHDSVRIEVSVRTGAALWAAKIMSGGNLLWSHTTTQGGQTTYMSDWIGMPSGRYNLTFATIGIGSMEAEIKITSKGGLW